MDTAQCHENLVVTELYDPGAGMWSGTGSLATGRRLTATVALPAGRVLVAGGFGDTDALTSVEYYQASSGTWAALTSMNAARYAHTATLLNSGLVLVTGGSTLTTARTTCELFSFALNGWNSTGALAVSRYYHTATLLGNGRVLVTGGQNIDGATATAELYDPDAGLSAIETWRLTHFGSPANSGDGADLNDYEKDGIANLLEFAFGLHPKQNSAGQLPRPQRIGGNFVVSFTQPAGVSGITYGAEWSTTLLPGSWTNITDTGNTGASPPQHTFSVPTAARPELFMRLKVTSP